MQRFDLRNFWLAAAACVAAMMMAVPRPASAEEATRISGIGYFGDPEDCPEEATLVLFLTGDLEGHLCAFAETGVFTNSGTYVETGTELYVDADGLGTFETTYRFEAKYAEIGNFDSEIFGRCQHVIVEGTGTGIFEGVTGRIDFKDDIDAGNFPYRGSLQFPE